MIKLQDKFDAVNVYTGVRCSFVRMLNGQVFASWMDDGYPTSHAYEGAEVAGWLSSGYIKVVEGAYDVAR